MPLPTTVARDKPSNGRITHFIALVLCMVMGIIYVSKTWSPSSYGYVLVVTLGYADSGPRFGAVRTARSDEFAVVTPLTQATVNNEFERINHTSLYGEDLRINYGLPIRDWGLAFKPTMWLYGFVNPAYAYSMHWFALSALFVFGYAWLFRWLGAAPVISFTLASGLYFTGFVQFWWNEKGPIFALFPWVLLPFATRISLPWKAAWFYWAAVAWLLTNFYPPVQLSLAFAGLVILLAREPDLFRPKTLLWLLLACAFAAGTAALYLWDYLQATVTTIYPGSRIVSGGTVPWRYGLSWLLPAINFDHDYESLIGANICEIGTVGMYYFLLVGCFLDFSRWHQAWSNNERRRLLAALAAGWLMTLAWMALPLPSWLGAPLLWNHVQPVRMQYAAGLLLACLTLVLVNALGLRISLARLAIFCSAITLGWWAWEFDLHKNPFEAFAILAFVLPACVFARYRPATAHLGFALASLLAGVLLFGRFNPLQSAWPIFNHPPNPMTKALDQLAVSNGGVLAVTQLPGATANGLGYRSLSHVTAVPQLDFWRKQFPDMPKDEFKTIFNRYAHIIPHPENAPRLLQADAVAVPVKLFQKLPPVRYVASPAQALLRDGYVGQAFMESGQLVISGWGPWSGPLEAHELEITLNASPLGPPTRAVVIRLDLPPATANKVSALNGFTVQVPLGEQTKLPSLCLVAYDSSTGQRRLLHNPPEVPYCQPIPRPEQ